MFFDLAFVFVLNKQSTVSDYCKSFIELNKYDDIVTQFINAGHIVL